MDRGELPMWLDDTSFEAVVERPALGPELRAAVRQLQARVWHSPARLAPAGATGSAPPIRVCAQTAALPSGAVVTLVVLGMTRPVADRPRTLRTLIHAYSARFSDEKWRRTRWFLAEADGYLAELKLQAHPDRRIWFLQEFNVD